MAPHNVPPVPPPAGGPATWAGGPGRSGGRLVTFWRQVWGPEPVLFLVCWLALLVGGRSRLFRDPGTFWHTRVGQLLLEPPYRIEADPFSCTAGRLVPADWIPHQWLGECLMALLHRLAGWDGLLLFTATLLAGLYTWVGHRLLRAGFHWVLAAALVGLTAAASSSHFHVRPHLSTIVFFGLTCALLNDFEAGRAPLRRLFWLVPVSLLWTNLHGGLLGALATLGLAVTGWVVYRLLRAPNPLARWGQAGALALLLLCCGLTTLVNPYGWRLPAVWVEIMRQPHLTEIIQEHTPLDPREPSGQTVLALAGVYLVVLAGTLSRWPRVTWLLPLVWLYLACTRIRHAPLFSLAATLAVADIFPHTRWAAALARRGSDLFLPPHHPAAPALGGFGRLLLPVLVVTSALGLQLAAVPAPVLGRDWARFDPRWWPVGLEETLRRYPAGTPVFNELNLGGYLIFYAPQLRVFIDDRCELYGSELLVRYDHATTRDPTEVEQWTDELGLDVAIVLTGSRTDDHLRRPGSPWTVVRETPAATLLVRIPKAEANTNSAR